MKRGLVVYGVDGIMEWNAVIPIGGAKVNVPFKYGSYNGYGTSSACYRTEDTFFQQVIENSKFFATGKIFIIKDCRIDENLIDEQESESEEKEIVLSEVEVSSREDAKQYLMDNFGFTAKALKSKDSIIAAAKANGIVFVGCEELM